MQLRGYALSPFWSVSPAEPHLMSNFPLSPHHIPPKKFEILLENSKKNKKITTTQCNQTNGHRLDDLGPSFSISSSFLSIRIVLSSHQAFPLLLRDWRLVPRLFRRHCNLPI